MTVKRSPQVYVRVDAIRLSDWPQDGARDVVVEVDLRSSRTMLLLRGTVSLVDGEDGWRRPLLTGDDRYEWVSHGLLSDIRLAAGEEKLDEILRGIEQVAALALNLRSCISSVEIQSAVSL